jgi:biopolymer transport protein ExbD
MHSRSQHAVELQIAPLIDVCFLLLFFYLLTAQEGLSEKSIATPLPGSVTQPEALAFGDVPQVQITSRGEIYLNGKAFDSPDSMDLPDLRNLLGRLHQSALLNHSVATITLCPEETAPYQRLIDVLSACKAEGIDAPLLAAPGPQTP